MALIRVLLFQLAVPFSRSEKEPLAVENAGAFETSELAERTRRAGCSPPTGASFQRTRADQIVGLRVKGVVYPRLRPVDNNKNSQRIRPSAFGLARRLAKSDITQSIDSLREWNSHGQPLGLMRMSR